MHVECVVECLTGSRSSAECGAVSSAPGNSVVCFVRSDHEPVRSDPFEFIVGVYFGILLWLLEHQKTQIEMIDLKRC